VTAVPRRVRGPCLLNLVPGGKTPVSNLREVEAMGYRIAIVPGLLLGSTVLAGDAVLEGLKTTGVVPTSGGGSVRERLRRLGSDEWDAIRRRHSGADGADQ
jgi:2-methylisocitrate lyase-like PEP mutase family enzyme